MLTAQQLSYMIEQNTVAERMIVLFFIVYAPHGCI